MSKPKSRKYVEEYDSDGGFIEDAPKSKKVKTEPKQRTEPNQKKVVSQDVQKDEDGNEYWEISGKRRVFLSEFKKMTMIGIREFYEKDGKSHPGQKGINLTIDQYTALIDILPDLERVLKAKGVDVPRPRYDKKPAPLDEEDEEDETGPLNDEDDEEKEDAKPSQQRVTLNKFKARRNHDATSDEDEE